MNATIQRMANQRGQMTIFMLLMALPLVTLVFFVHNATTSLTRATATQVGTDLAAASAGQVYARGLNAIEAHNAEISLLAAVEVLGDAVPKALEDARQTAYALAAAFWWSSVMYGFYMAYAEAIEAIQPALDALWEVQRNLARVGILTRGAETAALLATFPAAAAGEAKRIGQANGLRHVAVAQAAGAAAVLPLPRYPLQMSRVGELCALLKRGSPASAPPRQRRVYAPLWGWPTDEGTVEHMRDTYAVDLLFYALLPVMGPLHLDNRVAEATDAMCDDDRLAPALYDGTATPDAQSVMDRLRLVVVGLRDHDIGFEADLMNGGPMFREPQPWGNAAIAQVELVNAVSIDGTSAAYDARLAVGDLYEATLQLYALSGGLLGGAAGAGQAAVRQMAADCLAKLSLAPTGFAH